MRLGFRSGGSTKDSLSNLRPLSPNHADFVSCYPSVSTLQVPRETLGISGPRARAEKTSAVWVYWLGCNSIDVQGVGV